MKAYKFKLKTSQTVREKLELTLNLCRELYNSALRERIDAYRINHVSVSYQDQQNQLPEIKLIRDDLKAVYSQVLQDALKRLDKTFAAFFGRVKHGEKAGFPRFKSQNKNDSFTFPSASGGYRLDGNDLFLSKIGKVKIRLSRAMEGRVKTLTIKREVSGWFAIFTVETEKEILPKTGKSIGIDAGIESFMTLSDGTQIENFKYFEASQKQLRVAGRKVSRRKKSSNQRRKAVLRLRKIHAQIKNQRNDFAHKVSTNLVKEYDLIAIENLNILGTSKGILAKEIHDVAWNSFFQKLKYKAENAGKSVVEVNPNGTSQTCICGARVEKTLAQRQHICLKCGHSEHRDIVSAKVILSRAGQTRKDVTYAVGQSVSLESPSIIASI
ncbi:MAG: transposase [Acidobacteriota bacterium]|nr:transposase [Acidobacteriota bacterium]